MECLSWSTWKECTGCKDNEMCMVPVAPMSAVEDYDHPRCRDVRNLNVSGAKVLRRVLYSVAESRVAFRVIIACYNGICNCIMDRRI